MKSKAFIISVVLVVIIIIIVAVLIITMKNKKSDDDDDDPDRLDGDDRIEYINTNKDNIDQYYVKRGNVMIAPPYLCKLSWEITQPSVPPDTTYDVTVNVTPLNSGSITYNFKTTDTFVTINPLTFAMTDIDTYRFETKVRFNVGGKNYTYEFFYSAGRKKIPYLITEVNSPFRIPNVWQDWRNNEPIYSYGNAYLAYRDRPTVVLGVLALSSTDSFADADTVGVVDSNGGIIRVNNNNDIITSISFSIPKFDIKGDNSRDYEAVKIYQQRYSNLLMINSDENGLFEIPVFRYYRTDLNISLSLRMKFPGNPITKIINIAPINLPAIENPFG